MDVGRNAVATRHERKIGDKNVGFTVIDWTYQLLWLIAVHTSIVSYVFVANPVLHISSSGILPVLCHKFDSIVASRNLVWNIILDYGY